MTTAGLVSLLQLAITLLIAAQAPNVPAQLKTSATSVANQAIAAANAHMASGPLAAMPTAPSQPADPERVTTQSAQNGEVSVAEPVPTAPPIVARLMSGSTHTSVGEGLKTALVKFEIIPQATSSTIVLRPQITARSSGTLSGRGLQYHPKGEFSYRLINYPSGEPIVLTPENAPHVFEFYHSYTEPVLAFDYTIDADVMTSASASSAVKGSPITGTYDTCKDLAHLYEIRVLCDVD
jgi:hypothetical protein